jgi:hypothetical protein
VVTRQALFLICWVVFFYGLVRLEVLPGLVCAATKDEAHLAPDGRPVADLPREARPPTFGTPGLPVIP